MLSLMDPLQLADVVMFRDDEDPRKFYALPDQPVVSLDEDGEPEFLFIKYIRDLESTPEDAEASGGYVQLRTVLRMDDARRTRIVEELRARLQADQAAGVRPFGLPITSTEPLLAAPLWTGGTVSLATFKVGEEGLVRHATEQAPVDLAGDLGASFRLDLDAAGSEIFWGAFRDFGEQAPILITYDLAYKARVSARMTIHAKREVVHRQLWSFAQPYRLVTAGFVRYVPVPFAGTLSTGALQALRLQHGAAVKAMIEPRLVREAVRQTIVTNQIDVRIETDQAGGGEDEAKVRQLMFDVASEVLSDRLIPALFGTGAALPGASGEQDGKATRDLVEIQQESGADGSASFDLSLDHQSTVERRVSPNGPIRLSVPDPSMLPACFKELRLADGFFKALRVVVSTAGVNFERDGIDKIQVWLRYDEIDEPHPARPRVLREQNGTLLSDSEPLRFARFDVARRADGSHKRAYRYRTQVIYRNGTVSPPGEAPWRTSSDSYLVITPAAVGAIRVEVALTAGKTVDAARVNLKHRSRAGRSFETVLELTPDADRRTWFQFTGDEPVPGESPRYSYQVQYRMGAAAIVTPWTDAAADVLEIPTPFSHTLVFTVRPQGSFEGVSEIAGQITYEDAAHAYRVSESFALQKPTDAYAFKVPVLAGAPEVARWEARVKYANGSTLDLGTGPAGPGTIWIGPEISDVLAIEIRPDLIDFEADVQLAIVELRYVDAANGVDERRTFTFSKSSNAAQTWRVPRRDRQLGRYDVRIRFVAYDRSKSSELTLSQVDDQVLLLDRAAAPR
jgi:hypothetical protein